MVRRRPGWTDPHMWLGAGVATVLAAEYLRASTLGDVIPVFPLQVLVAVAVLALVFRRRHALRLAPLLAISFALQVGWVLVRLHADPRLLVEQVVVYAPQGQHLLDGHYPESEYPVGAVLLFALEAALGGADSHIVHSFMMVPFQLAIVASAWSLRTGWSPWFAAVLAFWPVNAWFWEFRFDVAPVALLAVGLALAWRRRWELTGVALSLGFILKWSPGLALLPLVGYLLSRRDVRSGFGLAVGAALPVLLVYLPFVLWSPGEVLSAYSQQGDRSITGESIWHLPLDALDLEGRDVSALAHTSRNGYPIWQSVDPPAWANGAAIGLQLAALTAVAWLSTRTGTLRGAVALAAMMPVIFLITNRVFSVQWFVIFFAAWLIAAALIANSQRETVGVTVVACAATVANVLILPLSTDREHVWELLSVVRFGLGVSATVWLVARAVRTTPEVYSPSYTRR